MRPQVNLKSSYMEVTGPYSYDEALNIIVKTKFYGYTVRASDGQVLDTYANGKLVGASFFDCNGAKGWAPKVEQEKP